MVFPTDCPKEVRQAHKVCVAERLPDEKIAAPELPSPALSLEADLEQAHAACAEVADENCKPDSHTFDSKRFKVGDVPESYTCVRKYTCGEDSPVQLCFGKFCFGR